MHRRQPHAFLFFVEEMTPGDVSATITGSEHHHLNRVLRKAVGDEVFITDGRGTIFRCQVQERTQRGTRVEVIGSDPVHPPRNSVTLALGCIRKDRFERAVEQCTELGVARFVPFYSRNTRMQTTGSAFMKRLRRIAQSAMTQSFRGTLPVIEQGIPFGNLIRFIKESDCAIVGDWGAQPLKAPKAGASVLLIVGPESGFAPEERDQLRQQGCIFASSSSHRLRSETAAVALASVVLSAPD
ncbi:MAG: RsmE family RNA methyltransferase [Candidatus Latescibacteria bacterium]|nr:RsmE family RNA methyltransferase [Candidatus Latescibacterota bacterium]NIM22173.1 RsmE family RNA methyltransferase [Candidatus Latescibacterota bacterium]NIM64723.1 RsmE family RNA methyltransferase [Candidatus Latescibacterota bacterium]NIO01233.1 RsmE family RNA methyltransferase [Candidatus Latescibacterota bacterium]NIO27618.1 RsmE family RNA methyltransferase [Candidatus Latescibacterota bacterium]